MLYLDLDLYDTLRHDYGYHNIQPVTEFLNYLFYFEKTETTLRVYNAHKHDRKQGDIKVTDVAEIAPLGFNSLDDVFEILSLNSDKMILIDEKLRLVFRRQ